MPIWTFAVAFAAASEPLPADAAAAWTELRGIDRATARFEQVQHRAILTAPLVSTGTLWFERPARLRWEVDEPVRQIFVMDGTTVGTALPALDHRETMDLASSPEAARLVQGLTVWLGADLEKVTHDYAIEWRPGPPRTAVLTPIEPALARIVASMELVIEGTPARIRRVVLAEPGGDRVEIVLTDLVTDGAPFPEQTFRLP